MGNFEIEKTLVERTNELIKNGDIEGELIEYDEEARKKEWNEKHAKYLEEVKKLAAEHTPMSDTLNEDWEALSNDFAKYDWDDAWEYMVDSLIFKLERMRAYLRNCSNTVEEEVDKMVKSLDKAIELGKYAVNYKNTDAELEFSRKHTKPYVVISDRKSKEELITFYGKYGEESFIHLGEEEPEHIAKAKEWCRVRGYVEFDHVSFAYGSHWDLRINYWRWKHLLHVGYKKKQKAFDKFFLYVSRNMQNWWD